MKRILCALLLSALLLPLVCCGAGGKKTDDIVLPPVRVAENCSRISLPAYTFEEAFDEADAVARIAIGDWLGEDLEDWATYYEAKVLQCFKGDLPEKIILRQSGDSSNTTIDYPLFTSGNEMLVFIKHLQINSQEADATKYSSEYWWLIGAYTTIFDVAYDNEGHRYYADRFGHLSESISIPLPRHIPITAAIRRQIRAYLAKKDPLLKGVSYSYIYAEDDLLPLLKRG